MNKYPTPIESRNISDTSLRHSNNVQKTSQRHIVFLFLLVKHKMFLRRLLDIHNVQKTSERHFVFLLSVNTRCFLRCF